MLHLEGRALNWHNFYMQEYGDPDLMDWNLYAQDLKERFGTSIV